MTYLTLVIAIAALAAGVGLHIAWSRWTEKKRDARISAQRSGTYDVRIDTLSEDGLDRLLVHKADRDARKRDYLKAHRPDLYAHAVRVMGWNG